MIIEITRDHRRWKPGDIVDVTTTFGNELIALGIARKHEDQTRRDMQDKKPEPEPQKIEVNNYFMAAEPEPPAPEPKQKRKK